MSKDNYNKDNELNRIASSVLNMNGNHVMLDVEAQQQPTDRSNTKQKQEKQDDDDKMDESLEEQGHVKQQQHDNNNHQNQQQQEPIMLLEKKERRRLKKLLKRAALNKTSQNNNSTTTCNKTNNDYNNKTTTIHHNSANNNDLAISSNSEKTGIICYKDYSEIQSLLLNAQQNKQSISSTMQQSNHHNENWTKPYITMDWRRHYKTKMLRNNDHNQHMIDGNDHRNLLYNLITTSLITCKYDNVNIRNQNQNNDSNNNAIHEDGVCKKRKQEQLTKDEEKEDDVEKSPNQHEHQQSSSLLPIHIPSWITIHNPMMVEHIAIIELNVEYDQLSTTLIDQEIVNKINQRFSNIFQAAPQDNHDNTKGNTSSSSTRNSPVINRNNNDHNNLIKTLKVNTKWYQGMKPKSISDVLMYTSIIPNSNKNTKNDMNGGNHRNGNEKNVMSDTSKSLKGNDMYTLLQPFILTKDQLTNEGFPCCIEEKIEFISTIESDLNHNESLMKKSNNIIDLPCIVPSIDDSIQYIQKCHIDIIRSENNNNNNNNNVRNHPDFDHRPKYVTRTTQSSSLSVKHGNIFAIDCEMVVTIHGSELARITLLQLQEVIALPPKSNNNNNNNNNNKQQRSRKTDDENQNNDDNDNNIDFPFSKSDCHHDSKQNYNNIFEDRVKNIQIHPILIFDHIVKPKNTIVDYVTQYSGMTPTIINGTNVLQIEQIQAMMLSIIQPNDIIIGHSLENDLHAIRFMHSTIIDTSMVFRMDDSQTFKFSLRHLSAVLLKKHIQQINQSHCSEIDAVTALELTICRAIIGPTFTIRSNNNNQLCNRRNNLNQLTKKKLMKAVCIGPIEWVKEHILHSHRNSCTIGTPPNSVHVLQCESIRDPNAKALKAWLNNTRKKADLIWAQFLMNVKSNNKNGTSSILDSEFDLYEKYFNELFQLIPPKNTVLLIAIQHGLKHTKQLYQLKITKRSNRSTLSCLSTDNDENKYQNSTNICQNGLAFWITTNKQQQT